MTSQLDQYRYCALRHLSRLLSIALTALFPQIGYRSEIKDGKKTWSFWISGEIEEAPKRSRDTGNIPFTSNPGPIIDHRAIEYELFRPTMGDNGFNDQRNKDVVPFNPAMSALYGCNNNMVALAVRALCIDLPLVSICPHIPCHSSYQTGCRRRKNSHLLLCQIPRQKRDETEQCTEHGA